MKKQEDVICNQEKKHSVETHMLMTDGKIIYKPKTRYKYVQGFKGNPVLRRKTEYIRKINKFLDMKKIPSNMKNVMGDFNGVLVTKEEKNDKTEDKTIKSKNWKQGEKKNGVSVI